MHHSINASASADGTGPNVRTPVSGRNSLTVDHDNALHERIDSDRPASDEAAAKMHARLPTMRSVCRPGHLQAVGERSRAARQQSEGGATSGAPAAAPVRGRGAFCDELRTLAGGCPAPGHRPGRSAAGGRSAADGKRCSDARRADRDNSSVLRRVARCGAEQPRECGAVEGIGGSCGQNRGPCAPLLRPLRRSNRRKGTRRVPAPAPQWRPARSAHLRRHRHHAPRCRPRTAAQ